jgi:neutral amino acid transport system permease protein
MDWIGILSNAAEAAIGADMVIYCLAAIGLNIHFGYAGLLNFGQAAFVAVGAFGLSSIVATWGLPFWLGLVVSMVAAGLMALVLGIPTLRLRAEYLAIVTLAAAEIVRLVLGSVTLREYFGGSDGLTGFADGFYELSPYSSGLSAGPFQFGARETWALTVGWVLVVLTSALVWMLMRSPWGRVLKGIREDEDAVRSLGKNVYSYKLQALMIGGIIGGLAGVVYALARASTLANFANPTFTFFVYTILILGGAARVFGPILGAALFWALLSLTDGILRGVETTYDVPAWLLESTDVGAVRFMLVGLALMLLMIYRPQGILGDRKELALDVR